MFQHVVPLQDICSLLSLMVFQLKNLLLIQLTIVARSTRCSGRQGSIRMGYTTNPRQFMGYLTRRGPTRSMAIEFREKGYSMLLGSTTGPLGRSPFASRLFEN